MIVAAASDQKTDRCRPRLIDFSRSDMALRSCSSLDLYEVASTSTAFPDVWFGLWFSSPNSEGEERELDRVALVVVLGPRADIRRGAESGLATGLANWSQESRQRGVAGEEP